VGDAIGAEYHVAVQIAEEAIEDYPSQSSSPVVRRPRKFDKELLAEFWSYAGFLSPSSHFWERRSSPDSAAQGMVVNGASVCRSWLEGWLVVAGDRHRCARRACASYVPLGSAVGEVLYLDVGYLCCRS
jgi:hypothetical protein